MRGRAHRGAAVLAAALALGGCGGSAGPEDGAVEGGGTDAGGGAFADAALPDGRVVRGPFATRVVSFEPGAGAGFGQSRMPDVVLGPPVGAGDMAGGTDVVSLGAGGRICLAFDDVTVVDGPGVDFIVFENPFYRAGVDEVWAELGEVSVSEDGTTFRTFACTRSGPPFPGCAGWNPVYANPGNGLSPNDPRTAGGDGFDLGAVGLARARVVCIRDLETRGPAPPSTGFDLDAISAVNYVRE
jgi:hypothetical protein